MKRSMWTTMAILVLGAAIVIAAPRPAHAVQDQDAFAALTADLEHRRDNELAAPEGKAAKKQRKAVLKCLKLLGKPSKDTGKRSADIKVAAKCEALVRKPFADELAQPPKLADLSETLSGLTMHFRGLLDADLEAAEDGAAALPDKIEKKVTKQTEKARRSLDALAVGEPDLRTKFKRLVAAQRAVESAQKLADKATLGGKAKREHMVMTVNGEAWKSGKDDVLVQFFDGDGGLTIKGQRDRADGGIDEIEILIRRVTGKGRFPLADADRVEVRYTERPAGQANVRYTLPFAPDGVLVVDEFDKQKPRFRVRFRAVVEHPTAGTLVITSGAADIGLGNVLGSGGPLFF